MHVLVAGAAGFIGSAVSVELVGRGHSVTAVDSFDSTLYSAEVKRQRAKVLERIPGLSFIEHDLTSPLSDTCWGKTSAVMNFAAVPGLLPSWESFAAYVNSNLLVAETLARSAVSRNVTHFVQASTSSVYGRSANCDETAPTQPVSPYGVSKLAAEDLIRAYSLNFGLPYTILRYFSVYGPGQRSDMAYHIFCERLLSGQVIEVFGDGTQSRSNTYISDCALASVAALEASPQGQVFNIAGMESIKLIDAITELSNCLDVPAHINFCEARPGDQRETSGDFRKAKALLGFQPVFSIREGLRRQARWHLNGRPADCITNEEIVVDEPKWF